LWELDSEPSGFDWLGVQGADNNVVAFVRRSEAARDLLVCVCNLSPIPRHEFRVSVPRGGRWLEVLNTDSRFYGGSDVGNIGYVDAVSDDTADFLVLTLPPLATVWFVPETPSIAST
jgi:1,4-alpha-glucan branching enzyme